jgi:hypothetical protein
MLNVKEYITRVRRAAQALQVTKGATSMERARRVSMSAATVVLICFFLPWIQVSCGGFTDSDSGFDLARGGDRSLWLVPLLMLAVIWLGLLVWKKMAAVFALVSVASGLISAYLMNRERLNAEQTSGLVGTRVTGWFWLGLFSSLVVVASAVVSYLKRSNPSER